MVTSTRGCLTPKGHSAIDCSSPPWLRSWRGLALWRMPGMKGVEQRERASGRGRPLIQCQLENLSPDHKQPWLRPLNHSGFVYRHCLFTLNYCFSPRAQTTSQVLPVYTSASASAQLLRHAIACIQWGNLTEKTLSFFLFPTRLSRDPIILSA